MLSDQVPALARQLKKKGATKKDIEKEDETFEKRLTVVDQLIHFDINEFKVEKRSDNQSSS